MEVIVSDSFNVKGRVALEYGATGVVAIFPSVVIQENAEPGKPILVIRPDGWMVRMKMGEMKRHGGSLGVFLDNLTTEDVPIGSRLRWGSDFWPEESTLSERQAAV